MTTKSKSKTTSGNQNSPLVVIVGETASGKSALALDLAQTINKAAVSRLESGSVRRRESQTRRTTDSTLRRGSQGGKPRMAKKPAELAAQPANRLVGLEGAEIICADSRTIYKGMDIGTAKPTKEDRAKVPHHLLDMAEPDEPYSAADFKRDALEAIKEIRQRGKVPIMVGGTGLYIDAVVFDYNFRTKYNAKIRAELQKKPLAQLRELAKDAGFTTIANSSNRRHLIRVLESGQMPRDDRTEMGSDVVIIGLKVSRAELRKRLKSRIEQMFRRGLRKEVDELAKKYSWEHESLTGIGYREFEGYYMKELSMSQAKRNILQHSLNYAKRQRTWFKRNPDIIWFDDPAEAKTRVLKELDRV